MPLVRVTLSIAIAAHLFVAGCAVRSRPLPDDPRWLTYEAGVGAGEGRHIVLIAADQEYRSEQSLPMLARILAERHGFSCTVLFAQNESGLVDPTMPTRHDDPDIVHRIPGLEQLASADLLILFSRFMTLEPDALRYVIDYIDGGGPVIALRTANHGFLGPFPYEIDGRSVQFGEDVLGGIFRGHHGAWHREGTRGIVVEDHRDHPILRGVDDVWGPSDVYRTYPVGGSLPDGCTPLLLGQPLLGHDRDSPPNTRKTALPVAWTKTWTGSTGRVGRVFHCTMGSARDFCCEDLRRLVINAAFWCLHLEEAIEADADVTPLAPYDPLASGFDYEAIGIVPRPPSSFRQ